MKIAVIDYDIGNVRSIINAFEKIGVTPTLTRDHDTILSADGVLLPGVGAFSHGMEMLKKYNLDVVIHEYAKSNKPFMGVCLGMQMLLDSSEEFGECKGLGLIEGKVVKLPVKNKEFEKLPHISWNEIKTHKIDWKNTILDNISEYSDVYFVHSFVAQPKFETNILSATEYSDYMFCSSVKKDNIYGCQFHPEKSGEIGLSIIRNFIEICKEKKNV